MSTPESAGTRSDGQDGRIETPRLTLIAATPALLRAELAEPPRIGEALGAAVPADWPPGEYDRDAIAFFLERMTEGGDTAAGWYGWYAVWRAEGETPATLAGSAGYFGPPEAGTAEIGYSVSAEWRGRGIATEAVRALIERAARLGVGEVVARTRPGNPASIGVLERLGFHAVESAEPELLAFSLGVGTNAAR